MARTAKIAINESLAPDNIVQSVLVCDLLEIVGYKKSALFYVGDWENIKKTGLCTPMISNIQRVMILWSNC
ncbi:MAG: hypothetical protein PHU62_07440 [Bacteroidales bacterium]|nr:hypothetical protein [Bacteroidales bacterium]MDD4634386.1 hypothetical protein [Bacteroidales bacterium]